MIILLLFFFVNIIKTAEDLDLKTYEKLNTFEMIKENQNFIIKVTEPSIAYFDSFDKNSITYISKNKTEFINQIDEKITGKFYLIDPNIEYYVRNILYFSNYTSTFKKYLYPLDISKEEIKINNDINFLYFKENINYILNFEENTVKKIIKLSRKTLNSKIIITKKNEESGKVEEEVELNENVLYYKLEEGFKKKLYLTIKENKAFIEFLSNEGEYEILEEESKTNYEITKNTTIIKIENNQEDFLIELESDNPFNYSFSYGFTNEINYYYYIPNSKIISPKKDNTYFIEFKLFTPFKNINLIDKEFFSFSINIDRDSSQKIKISYKRYSKISPLLKESLNKEDCDKIIANLKNVFELYVFTDIAKNPPEISNIPNYHHPKINIQEELSKISTENRYFYEFYQELMKILTSTKDLHLSITSYKTPKGIPFQQYGAALPFNFIIKKVEGKYKIFINKNNYFSKFEQSVQNFINDHLNIPIKTINDIDPFDYIQNWSKFKATKNIHAQFTYIINLIISAFYLKDFPLSYSDLNLIEYEFEDNKILRIPYYLEVPNLNDIEFNNFFTNYIKNLKDETDYEKIPFIDEIREKFLISKGLKKQFKQEKKEKIEWKFSIINNNGEYLKCRVDEVKKVNVVAQTSFNFDVNMGFVTIVKCAKLFHENNYPIIIIESLNTGGKAVLYMIMYQLFQMRTVDRSYFSIRMTDISKEFFKNDYWDRNEPKTCKNVNTYNDLKEKKDYYNYNGLSIEHIRCEEIDILPYYYRTILRDLREEYKDSKNLKKPTDIIVFSDSSSFSATSGLIKGFQNTGGAIIVGFYGNPTKEGIDLFDGSQSISSVRGIEGFYLYNNLYDLGIKVSRVTLGETFDGSIYKENPIPREYAFDPVDYRVDIYYSYSDDVYENFINEGLKIHSLFNDTFCNSKNQKLLLHNESCYNIGITHAHGGFKCKEQGNEWDKETCDVYYCDIGFYYNRTIKQCVEECSFNDTKSYLIYDKVDKLIYNIEKNIKYTFIIENEKSNYGYFYIASDDIISDYPKIGFVQSSILFLNMDNDCINNCTFEINGIGSNIRFNTIYNDKYSENMILLFGIKKIIILESSEDFIFYLHSMFNNTDNKYKVAKYEKGMKFEDIININSKYYIDFNNIVTLPKDEINIIYLDFKYTGIIHYYLKSKIMEETIEIKDKDTNFLYLVKDKTYTLNFEKNKINRMIKLSRKTLNSEINIIDENVKLNSDNLYYKIKDDFHGNIKINILKNDALIEFLFKQDDANIFDFENLETTSNKTYNLIKFSKKYLSKEITLSFKSDSIIQLNVFFGYSIPPYSYYYSDPNGYTNKYISSDNTFNLTFLIPYTENDKLSNDEYFCVLIESPMRNMEIKGIYKDKDKDKDDNSLKNWQIVLIIISSVIVFLLIIILIIYCYRKSNEKSNKEIEEKMEIISEIKEIK